MTITENIRLIWKDFNKNNAFLWATTLTYTTLFAIVPLLAVALSLFKAFGGFQELQENMLLPLLSEMLDPTHKIQVMEYTQLYVDKINAGALGIIGTVVFILTFVPLFIGMESAMNTIWQKVDDRPIWRKFVTYWTIITLGPIAIVATMSTASSFHAYIPGLAFLEPFRPMMLLGIILVLFLIYKLVPNTEVGTKPALIGATSSTICWIIANFGYKTYMTYATASFSIYGSLGAIPVFLLWIYINWIIFLFGVQMAKSVQYPPRQYPTGAATPAQLLKASLDLLSLIFN
ncbi:MAG: YihY/virulence factor BrkB family protein, partial [Deltaproteobacteria bacterium]|nr:YihY/virulence factor BrkB family protein [Deltaproteobacteria bacterium]